MKKLLALLTASLVILSILVTGCTSKSANKVSENESSKITGQSTTDGDNKNTEKENLKPYEILWYTIGTPMKDTDMVFEKLSEYTREKINASVKMKMFDWGEYNSKMQVIISSGEPYDLCFTSSWANDYRTNAMHGAFKQMDEVLDKYGKDIKEILHPAFLKGTVINGHNYALPVNKEVAAQAVWVFNKQYVDKYNLDISSVRNLESLEPLLKAIHEKQPDISAISGDRTTGPWLTATLPFDTIIGRFGVVMGKSDSNDCKVVNFVETPEMKKFVETMHKYYEAGYIKKDIATINTTDETKTGKWFVGAYHNAPYDELSYKRTYGYDAVIVPAHDPIIFNSSVSGSMIAISVTSKDAERAMMFLNLLNTDPYVRNMVDSGIEGAHYKLENGLQEDLQKGTDNYNMPSWSLGNMLITYLYKDDPADKWEAYEKFNNSAINSPTLGFSPDIEPIKTELAAIQNVIDEFEPILLNGAVDPNNYLPKYIDKLKACGSEKVVEELQKQINEWKANKK